MFMIHTQTADRRCFQCQSYANLGRKLKVDRKNKIRVNWCQKCLAFPRKSINSGCTQSALKQKQAAHVSVLLGCERRRMLVWETFVYFLSEALWSKHIANRAAETDGFSRREFVRKTFAFFSCFGSRCILARSRIFLTRWWHTKINVFLWCFISHLCGFFFHNDDDEKNLRLLENHLHFLFSYNREFDADESLKARSIFDSNLDIFFSSHQRHCDKSLSAIATNTSITRFTGRETN